MNNVTYMGECLDEFASTGLLRGGLAKSIPTVSLVALLSQSLKFGQICLAAVFAEQPC